MISFLKKILHLVGNFEETWKQYIGGDPDKLPKVLSYIKKHKAGESLPFCFLDGAGWTRNIGHIGHIDSYIKAHELGIFDIEGSVLIAKREEVQNISFLELFQKWIPWISEPELVDAIRKYCSEVAIPMRILNAEKKQIPRKLIKVSPSEIPQRALPYRCLYDVVQGAGSIECEWARAGKKPIVSNISDDLLKETKSDLKKMGLGDHDWFVTLHVRDSSYRDDAEHRNARNADIESYEPLIREIGRRGGWVIRLGNAGMHPYKGPENFIAYNESSLKSHQMDVGLCALSRAFIGTCSGLFFVPAVLGVPSLLTNWFPVCDTPYYQNQWYISKWMFDSSTGTPIDVKQVVVGEYSDIRDTKILSKNGLEMRNNTPDEITELVVEFLDNPNQVMNEDQIAWNQQLAGWGISSVGRMGQGFLKRHPFLLKKNDL